MTGSGPIVRRFPMVPGIDLSGRVSASNDARFAPGEAVVLTGWGAGEQHYGGFAGRARVPGDWLVSLPGGLSTADAMRIGTAGFTAMLAVMALEDHGAVPDGGPVIVTGASGGVGSLAVALMASAGFSVIAATGRPQEAAFLKELGAADILPREALAGPVKPLGSQRWQGGIDVVGGVMLANLLSMTKAGGTIAACGLVGGMALPATVAPFILRGVTLAGINSVTVPTPRRIPVWQRLARDLAPAVLDRITAGRIGLSSVIEAAPCVLAGQVRGRLLVDIG